MQLAILGNSGSGKSTLARWAAQVTGAPVLDLDAVAWEPEKIAVPRPESLARADVVSFCEAQADWIVEGCYAHLISAALAFSPRLIFLDPGEAACLANCRARPWEPHKYSSKAEQDEHLNFLLVWVSDYYSRDGEMSLSAHRALFESYSGSKVEVSQVPQLISPTVEMLAWLS